MWFIYKKRGLIDGIKTMDTDQWCSSTNQCFFSACRSDEGYYHG